MTEKPRRDRGDRVHVVSTKATAALLDRLQQCRKGARDDADLAAMSAIALQDVGSPTKSARALNAFRPGANGWAWSLLALVIVTALVATIVPGLAPLGSGFTGRVLVLTFAAILVGSVAAGVAGFAFSAITGALLFHWLAPATAVPLLLTCSITTQLVSITALWKRMQWRQCLLLLAGGLPAIPLGAYLLQHLRPGIFGFAFGALLAGYAGYMLLRPRLALKQGGRAMTIAIGFAGGITGGAVAFPGALPTIWCNLRQLPKDTQRGMVQPFILLMQLATIAYFSKLGIMNRATLTTFLWCVPAVLGGTWLGLRLYRVIDDAMFGRIALCFLFFSGVTLML